MEKTKEKTWTIHQLAAVYGITPHTLRFYERIGLIPPVTRDSSGRRRYGEHDKHWIDYLLCFRQTGMSLEEIKAYIALFDGGDSTAAERKELMVRQKEKIQHQMEQLQGHLSMIEYKISHYASIEEKMIKLTQREL